MVRMRVENSTPPPPPPAPPRPSRRRATKGQREQLTVILERIPGVLDIPEYVDSLLYDEAEWIIAEHAYPQFRKQGGEWVVMGDVERVKPGAVTVHKKDGTQTDVQVKKISEPFDHMGRSMVRGFIR